MQIRLTYFNTSDLPNWAVALAFFVPLIGGILLFGYKTRHARSWRKGIFPPSLKPTEDNFLEAYLALGAKLMLFNYQETKSHVQFINQYFQRYFTKANYNFGDSLLFSLRYPIQTRTITDWMNHHLPDEGSRSQVIFFLTGLALVTEQLSTREMHFLKEINADLGLKPENLTQILAIYASYHANRNTKNAGSESKRPVISKKYYYEILGIAENASPDEIKKAYRKLAKIHHPDHFATGTVSQQKMAAEKFMEIQRAYECLSGQLE